MNFPVHFSSQLREHLLAIRKTRGLTQAALGQLLGVGQARIAEIESNPGVVSADQLIKLLSALRASLVLHVDDAGSAADGAPHSARSPAPTLPTNASKPLRRLGARPPADGQWRAEPLAKGGTHATEAARASLGDARTASEAPTLRDADPQRYPTSPVQPKVSIRSKKGSW